MRDYTLSSKKIAEVKLLHRSLRDKRQADRVKAVIALTWLPADTIYQDDFSGLCSDPLDPVGLGMIINKN